MAEIKRRVRPAPLPIEAYLDNPHRGCCTFQHFSGDPLFAGTSWSEEGPVAFPPPVQPPVIDGYLPTTVAYCRWFWRIMEPERGRFDFSMIDRSLETCAARGQTLAVRLQAFGAPGQPQLPDWYVAACPTEDPPPHFPGIRYPVHGGPEYLEHWGGFVREFGRRYDGHPGLESIDLAYLGPWGEGDAQVPFARHEAFARVWQEAFPRTPRLCQIGPEQMAAGIASGTGWRCDSYGDLSEFGSPEVTKNVSWNHTFDCYPKAVCEAGAQTVWQRQPIHLETGWVPMGWLLRGHDIDFIIEQGLKMHPTYFMPKSTRLPEAWLPRLAAFCNRIGYRYIFRHTVYDRHAKPGGRFQFEAWIENVGVAPSYRAYTFALRLRQGDTAFVVPLPDLDIRTWQPGDVWINRAVSVPAGLRPGWAELSAGLLGADGKVRIKFANKEQFSDGWLEVGGVEIM